ncbi:MAG: hypothetical protein WAO29_04125 [Candidatus Nanopelagicales bacterium]
MPDTGAPWNIPYVENADLVRDWPADSLLVANAVAAGLTAAGGLVEVKSAIFTGTQTNSTAASANFAVTDLSITHEVADASNKLVILAMLGVVGNSAGRGQTGLAVHDGTSLIAVGAVASNRTSLTAGGTPSDGIATYIGASRSATFVHTPGAGSKTYTVRAVNFSQFTNTVYVNRNEVDTDNGDSPRGASSLVIMEVKV